MTKEELFEDLNYEDGDKIFIVRHRVTGTKMEQQLITNNFNVYELIGFFDFQKNYLMKSIEGKIEQTETKNNNNERNCYEGPDQM